MPTAQEIYTSTVRDLPPAERLRLAALILDELAKSGVIPPDSNGTWSDEDLRDLTAFSMQYAATIYPEDEDLV